MLTRRSIYSLKRLSLRTLFHTKRFAVMTEIHPGIVTKLKIKKLINKKNTAYQSYIQNDKNEQ